MKTFLLLAALVSVAGGQSTDRKVRVFVGESETWEASGFNVASASGSANWRSAQSSAGAFGMSHAGIVKLTVAVMKQLNESIKYDFVENEKGAQIRISTSNRDALKAIYDFLRFQIKEHMTGDPLEVDPAG